MAADRLESEMRTSTKNILIVENNAEIRKLLSQLVDSLGYHAIAASKARKAYEVLKSTPVDLILLDLRMPGPHGDHLLSILRKRGNQIPTIVVSGYLNKPAVMNLLRIGVEGMVAKPFTRARIREEIDKVFDRSPDDSTGPLEQATTGKAVSRCPQCGSLSGLADRYCSKCGEQLQLNVVHG